MGSEGYCVIFLAYYTSLFRKVWEGTNFDF